VNYNDIIRIASREGEITCSIQVTVSLVEDARATDGVYDFNVTILPLISRSRVIRAHDIGKEESSIPS